ncbi:hypothetical protein DICVIV_06348 [Dictyocaulus viviparus]|uniref:Uncharacterized protein n=1 Tax=Dictyocaulus viviparus TaxID=29172 RepID=A0A0D8XUP2_DICVI|nr:hypothetical protein DICVIV_06348 [Dictyocaulus viviparus]
MWHLGLLQKALQRMGLTVDDEHDEFNLTKKNSDSLFSNELAALFVLLIILLVASLSYIIVKTISQIRRSGPIYPKASGGIKLEFEISAICVICLYPASS